MATFCLDLLDSEIFRIQYCLCSMRFLTFEAFGTIGCETLMSKCYVKLFGLISLTAWQYEIFGCMPFYFLALIGILTYLNGQSTMILIPSLLLLLIGIGSPINVYCKEKNGYYEDPYRF